ncbi:Helix-turn-helix [uncultured archaeon]|nr:Helix-turn-helix [uncultured archaeon]
MARKKNYAGFAGIAIGKHPKRSSEVTNQLRVWRAKRNLTQDELAGRVGVTRQTIIAVEAGRYSPSLELAFKLARFFGTSIEGIFAFKDKSRYALPFGGKL